MISAAEKAGRHHTEGLPTRESTREQRAFLTNLGMAKEKVSFSHFEEVLLLVIFVLVLLLPKPHLLLRQDRYKQLSHSQGFSVTPSHRRTIWACLHEELHLITSVH